MYVLLPLTVSLMGDFRGNPQLRPSNNAFWGCRAVVPSVHGVKRFGVVYINASSASVLGLGSRSSSLVRYKITVSFHALTFYIRLWRLEFGNDDTMLMCQVAHGRHKAMYVKIYLLHENVTLMTYVTCAMAYREQRGEPLGVTAVSKGSVTYLNVCPSI